MSRPPPLRPMAWLALFFLHAAAGSSIAADAPATPAAAPQRAVLVTGASTGIGRRITEVLAAQGHLHQLRAAHARAMARAVAGDGAACRIAVRHDGLPRSGARDAPELSTMRNVARVTATVAWQRGQVGFIELPATPCRYDSGVPQ